MQNIVYSYHLFLLFCITLRQGGVNNNEETGIVNIADGIYKMKVDCAAEVLRAFLHNKKTTDPREKIDLVELFRSKRID